MKKILDAVFGVICVLLLSFMLQFNAAGARLDTKPYMCMIRDSGYYALYNDSRKAKVPYMILGEDKVD